MRLKNLKFGISRIMYIYIYIYIYHALFNIFTVISTCQRGNAYCFFAFMTNNNIQLSKKRLDKKGNTTKLFQVSMQPTWNNFVLDI